MPRLIYWKAHLNPAEGRYGQLRAFDEQMLALPVGRSNTGFITDELALDLYKAGAEMVVHTILAVLQLEVDPLFAETLRLRGRAPHERGPAR